VRVPEVPSENPEDMLSVGDSYFLYFFHINYSAHKKYFSYICKRNL